MENGERDGIFSIKSYYKLLDREVFHGRLDFP